MKKDSSFKIYFFLSFIYLYFFIIYEYSFSFEDTLKFGGADGFSYMSISMNSPFITKEKLMSIHSERFFSILNRFIFKTFFEINFLSYKIFVLIILMMINIFVIKILKYLNLNLQIILIFLTLINLNHI